MRQQEKTKKLVQSNPKKLVQSNSLEVASMFLKEEKI